MFRRYGSSLAAAAIAVVLLGAGTAFAGPVPGTRLAQLKASGTLSTYGGAVAVSGSTAVVGEDNFPASRGKVYVFTRTGAGWKRSATLTGPSPGLTGDAFGDAVAISGSTIAVGDDFTPGGSLTTTSKVFIYTDTAAGWKQAAVFSNPDTADTGANDRFGYSVATTGGAVYVGAFNYGVSTLAAMRGSVFVYAKTAAGWKYRAQLKPPSAAAYSLGWSLAASGSTVVAGTATCAGPCTNDQTSAWEFTRTSAGWKSRRLSASGLAPGDGYGYAVSISGSQIAVSALNINTSGHVFIFTRMSSGSWKQSANLKGPGYWGQHVGLSGNRLLISSDLENPRPVWFFSMNTAGWKLAAKVKMPVKSGSGWTPVAVSGPLAVIGGTSFGTGTTGFAYIYES